MKRLPIGQQNLAGIINENYIYVDKTKYIKRLFNNKYYFLSRPRRFGKSLLISTLKEIFKGNKELFKDLWIYDKIEWTEHPVIHISFSTLDYKNFGLDEAINIELDKIAKLYGITFESKSYSLKFDELIRKLSKDEKAVILIDEYDKPIIDYVDDIEQAQANRETLKSFYSVVKDLDGYIRFFFVTGVSKFSKVSIFSDLNNLNDITIQDDYALLTGITQSELEKYFAEHLEVIQNKLKKYYPNIVKAIENEYLGYSWDGENYVYNPFTILLFLDKKAFGDYWFQSGTPTFLMKLIKERNYTSFDIENKTMFATTFDKFEIEELPLLQLLFQTGYLTIVKTNPVKGTMTLDFPNSEVRRAFTIHMLANMNGGKTTRTNSTLFEMTEAIENDAFDKFMELFSDLLSGIAYPLIDKKEKYYHSIFYLVMKMMGFYIESEILTIDGRIDCVLKTDKNIYVIEFKCGNTQKAIEQIREKNYHQKYADDKRPKLLIGIDFDIENKKVADWIMEEV